LFVSRSKDLFPLAKLYTKRVGYSDIKGTAQSGKGLCRVINEYKPRLVFVEASFYDMATPYMLRELRKKIPWLNIAVFSLGSCPIEQELRFLFYGIERYISLCHGMADFIHGFTAILKGKTYVCRKVWKAFEGLKKIPEPTDKDSDREDEVLVMLANGKTIAAIAKTLNLSERAITHHKTDIFSRYQATNMVGMIRAAQNAGELKLDGIYYLERRQGNDCEEQEWRIPGRYFSGVAGFSGSEKRSGGAA
jgi:DNA-binding NarL/FixJ family response regulator